MSTGRSAVVTTTPLTQAHDALAADGRVVRIRPVEPQDATALRALYDNAGDHSLYLRFFTSGRGQIDAEVRRLTRPAAPDHRVVVALDANRLIGVASYERGEGEPFADFAVLIADAHHGRGIGTLLLEHLVRQARGDGIRELAGDILVANGTMLRVARDLTPGMLVQEHAGVMRVLIPTAADDRAQALIDLRERSAERKALHPLLAPASVAVVGASRTPGGVGHEVLCNLIEHGFTGPVYPVNPNADQVAGLTAYPSLAAVGAPVDLAIIAVPAPAVAAVLADAGQARVGAAVVLSSGFAEAGPDGAAAQAALVRAARSHGIRLVGPNCLGVLNTDPTVRLAATFATAVPPAGGLAIASQSGAVGIAVLDHATRAGIGVSQFVSLGNKADVSGNDLLAYWYDDPTTRAVALYLESFGNPRKFARIARALARRKPVLAVKGGRSVGGRRAGTSHTAAATAPDVAVDTLFAQAGVIRTDTLGELLDAARLLVSQPPPAGNRLGIVGNAGGVNVLAADAADAAGLVVPETTVGNPVDLGAAATPAALADTVARLAASGDVDAILAIFAATRANDVPGMLAALGTAADAAPDVPVTVVLLGVPDTPSHLGQRATPVYPLPERAVRALGHAARYAAWRREPLGRRPDLYDVDPARARVLVDRAIAAGGGWQPPGLVTDLLAGYGIRTVDTVVARGRDDAVAAATRLGYPVVVKAADPTITHKTDRHLVRLDLADSGAVRDAYLAIRATLGDPRAPVAVQPMRHGGVELAVGVVHDPLFGSLVMLGLGGIHTELLGDRAFRLLPVTDLDARRMWQGLRGSPLLTGYRGAPAVATAALEDLLARVGRLAEDVPEIAELDLNPVLAFPNEVVAVDAKLRLATVGAEPDPDLRALREPA
ncbi:GNAT family N-acetyltransferase [Planosporangium thailandense]|uniref:GNAT family N-acetyltransferase n=1 Tax=Planosporangium thailandense TaxID=765197 RepID=A0ABX0Y290_9ACTN|nr:bifunctional GNAT family N-acetyltransferase/acetate--CoA ligase family protein [Planosporangium thailandense]NJC72448.1 GNAT family N-acetyltransferase [Planosporangium thailandense]